MRIVGSLFPKNRIKTSVSNKKNKIIASLILVITYSISSAQISPIQIKADANYYWGEATDKDSQKANQNAVRNMMQKIQVAVSDRMVTEQLEEKIQEKTVYVEKAAAQISSISSLYLQNLKEIITKNKNEYTVLVYISKKDFKKAQSLKESKIIELIRQGEAAEQEGKIGQALKNYYWGCLLAMTYPYMINYSGSIVQLTSSAASISLQNKVSTVLSKIAVAAESVYVDYSTVIVPLKFSYEGKPIIELEFSYFSGSGNEYIKLRGENTEITLDSEPVANEIELAITIEYCYEAEMEFDREICDIYHNFNPPYMNNKVPIKISFAPIQKIDFKTTFKDQNVFFEPAVSFLTITDCVWDFGDGQQDHERSIIHKYENAGLYDVVMTLNQSKRLQCRKQITVGKLAAKPTTPPQNNPIVDSLVNIRQSSAMLQELARLQKEGKIYAGARKDFTSSAGLYVIVLDESNIMAFLRQTGSSFKDLSNGTTYESLDSFKGRRAIWVQVFE